MTDNTTEVEESEVNEPTPYQNEYKKHLNDPDTQDTSQEEATPVQEGFLNQESKPEHDYKKRYDDLKTHYDRKLNEWKQELSRCKMLTLEFKILKSVCKF